MKLGLALLLGLIVMLAPASAQDAQVRATIETKGDLWIGQRVTLVVELLAPGYFAGSAAFDLPNPPGLMLAPPEGSPLVSSETIADTTYTVQRHELSILAQRGGEQTIPSITVRFHFKRNPLDKNEVAATVKTPPVKFTVKVPPGAEKLGNLISARDLKVEETWKPDPGKAKAGDAFTRTIEYSAPDVPAMAFPPFPPGKIDGLGVYPKPPEVLDHSERGTLTGKRRDTITYICQRPGQFTIPAVRLTWFDLDAKKLQTIAFPARTFDVAPNPAMAAAVAASTKESSSLRPFLLGLLGALGVCGCAALAAKTWPLWRPVIDYFRPVHLAPLNPPARTKNL